MDVCKRIDELRKQRGWSINNLAMEAMLTQSTVNNLFVRNSEPKLSTLRAICNAFGITLSEFFKEEERENLSDIQLLNEIKKLSAEQKRALYVILKSVK